MQRAHVAPFKMTLLFSMLTIILIACSPTTNPGLSEPATEAEPAEEEVVVEEEAETAVSTDQPAPAPTDQPAEESATEEEEMSEEPSSDELTDWGAPIFTGDDRSDQLARLTSSWGTNWERRLISTENVLSGGPPRDGIPSIDEPQFISFDEAGEWLADNEPVIALEINGDARAYPLQILTWHEIVNDIVGDQAIVVTFCPLCNSALVFDATVNGQIFDFGVSGLLLNSDLIMYDRVNETLWQQFTGEAIVGDLVGTRLDFVPSLLVSYADFKTAFPEGIVLSRETGFSRSYGQNPYAGYDTIGSNPFLFNGDLDGRLPAVERVVTVTLEDEGLDVAYPLSALSEAGAINDQQGNQLLAVFHLPGTASALGARVIADAEDVGATAVFDPTLNGQTLTFSRNGDNFVDAETGSSWNIFGQAIDGDLAGEALTPIVHGNHFWFSWAAFKPDTVLYTGP